jgi:uncharacterized protein YgfB (UPF0149 family)
MIKNIIDEINVIIADIYKAAYASTDNHENNDELNQLVDYIRYYEVILHEIENKDSFQDVFAVEDSLIQIKKDLSDVLTILI